MTGVLRECDEKPDKFNKENELVKMYNDFHDIALRAWSPFLEEARKDLSCYLGDQWDRGEAEHLRRQGRNTLVFNRVRRNVKMITGYERRTRHSLVAQPVDNTDEMLSAQMTEALIWASNHDNMYNIQSDAFEACLKTGINLLELSMDYSDDMVYGDIKLNRIPYNQFLLDPRFTRRDLSDCQFILQRRLLTKNAVKALLPFRSDEIDNLRGKGRDKHFPMMTSPYQGAEEDMLHYDEFWMRAFKPVEYLIDQNNGFQQELDPQYVDVKAIKEMAREAPGIDIVTKQVPTVELAVIVENVLLYHGEDPYKIGDFPHVPVMAFWDPEHTASGSHFSDGRPGSSSLDNFFSATRTGDHGLKLQSLVRCIRDPQSEANKRRSKMLDILDSQVNSGWIAKEQAVVNPDDLYQSGQGNVIWMRDDAQMTDAQRINPPDIPAGLMNLSQLMDNDIVEISGITDELLGMAEDSGTQMSGVLAKLRQGAGLTVLQDLFDNYRLSQKLLGKKMVKMIQNNWVLRDDRGIPIASKLTRLLNEAPNPAIFDPSVAKFDISVQEAIETPSQRALAYTQLMQARQLGIPIPDSILIDYMPVTDKKRLREEMEKEAAQQAQIAQSQLEDQSRLRELQRAKVFSDIGLGVERIARAEADRGLAAERQSEFAENQAQAVLARVKAVKEIEEMDTNRLLKLLAFFKSEEKAQTDQSRALVEANEARGRSDLGFVQDFIQES